MLALSVLISGDFWEGQPIPWFAVYGFLTALTLLATWRSGDHVIQKLGLLLLLTWSISNFTVAMVGFSGAPYILPTADALIAVMVAMLGLKHGSATALAIVGLFLVEMCVHLVGFVTLREGTYVYFLALNLVFLAQLGVVGGVGCAKSLHRLSFGNERVFGHRSSA